MPAWLISLEALLRKVAAYLGAILGIYCTIRSVVLDRFRLKFRVLPDKTAIKPVIIIQATNVGRVAATVEMLGFSLRGMDRPFWPEVDMGLQRGNVRKLLNPGDSVSLYIGPTGLNNPAWGMIDHPIAQIADGRILKGMEIPKLLRENPLEWFENQIENQSHAR